MVIMVVIANVSTEVNQILRPTFELEAGASVDTLDALHLIYFLHL
jgi:hypothetical protein